MRIDPAGWPFVLGALVLAVLGGLAIGPALGIGGAVLAGLMLCFFRDPDRTVTEAPGAVLAPADGRVMIAGPSVAQGFPADRWQQVSIFLSPLDVHVNRMPIGGRVLDVRHRRGRFLPAYRQDAGDLNEYTEVRIDHDDQVIVVRQIVGVLARRIVCRTRRGAVVAAGERFGVMKFGSRMDVFLPATAHVTARKGQRAVGAVTVIATLENHEQSA